MMKERRKFLLSVLVYVAIIALVAFVLFHQRIVKQRAAEMAPIGPEAISFADTRPEILSADSGCCALKF
jgi:hypothetical protein